MRTDRELLEDALHQLGWLQRLQDFLVIKDLIEEIRARLAEKEDEPVGYFWEPIRLLLDRPDFPPGLTSDVPIIPLYRHPLRPTGLDQLLERIRFLEQQIAEKDK